MKRSLFALLGLILPSLPGSAATSPADILDVGFPRWDADGNGELTLHEVSWALASPEVRTADAALLAAIYRGAHHKTKALAEPFTLESLRAAMATPSDSHIDLDRETATPDLAGYYASALKRIEHTPRLLFASGAPQLTGFRQGKVGSCFCLAPLAALINRNPADVARRFTSSDSGYLVRISDQRTVWVGSPTDGELAISSTTGQDGYWSTVYEKAIGQMRIEDKGVAGPPLTAAVKGSAGTMIGVLTGHAFKRFSCSPWRKSSTTEVEKAAALAELRTLLSQATQQNRIMTVGTGSKGSSVPNIASWHAYAILAYDAKADTVKIRDPHGQDFTPKGPSSLKNGYPMQAGITSVPLQDLVQFMGGFAFEQDAPSTKSNSENETGEP